MGNMFNEDNKPLTERMAKTNEKTTTDFTVVPFDDLQLHMGEHEDYGQAMIIEYEGEHWTVIKLPDGRLTLGRQVME